MSHPEKISLTLFVAGQTPKSQAAIRNLEELCRQYKDSVEIVVEVVDLRKAPHLAKEHNIVAIPTLVRALPTPVQKIIGDLSNKDRVLVSLDINRSS